ncbi:NADH-quinone oxidoreductase subunit F [Pseudoduganella eburnea]|uniref:NADH-quinone oxidoreductase subunit F n=1 Tax=Massilia eburnea TaxID=1776165 RepID=A0A6L6QIT8_9BURK|nr:NADH-quinone oxidoreductase subunit F [Massilia eburnea]
MNQHMIPIAVQGASRERKRQRPKGRQVDVAALQQVQALLGASPRRRDLLIEYLHLIQDAYGCLSAAHLAALASELRLAQVEVFEVASFYHHFDIVLEGESAPPALTVRVCDGLPCELAGAGELLAHLPALLGRDVRVISAPCIGRCEQAPAVLVGQRALARASCESVATTVAADDAGPGAAALAARSAGEGGAEAGAGSGGGALFAVLRDCLSGARTVESVIAELEDSGLRGLGGAGFPAGRKWRIVREEPGPRLMAVNIDEGEPGTFKDRYYLERNPRQFIEGMLIAAWAVGIDDIYVYLRDEYHACRKLLQRELERLAPAEPRIHLRRGAGAYICGEESAMIESIEGKRGMPRLRPPFVAQKGLFGRPTLEHNFETLYWVPEILAKGAKWFASHGRHGRKGLRSFSVSGRVKLPGVKLAPAGITAQELIDEYCGGMLDGHQLYAYLPGGASGGILPASMANIALDFDTLQPYGCFIGSAAIIVLSQHDSARAAAGNMMRFFRHESCGQCTPCRAGTAKAVGLIEQPVWDASLLGELSQVMRDASICGLGQAAPNPVDCVLKYFPHEVIR